MSCNSAAASGRTPAAAGGAGSAHLGPDLAAAAAAGSSLADTVGGTAASVSGVGADAPAGAVDDRVFAVGPAPGSSTTHIPGAASVAPPPGPDLSVHFAASVSQSPTVVSACAPDAATLLAWSDAAHFGMDLFAAGLGTRPFASEVVAGVAIFVQGW